MKKAVKRKGITIKACRVGGHEPMLEELISEGKIKKIGEDTYVVFSLEAVNGEGQIAKEGDYIKLDSAGFAYPNSEEYFLKNHRHIAGNEYEQIPSPVSVWSKDEPMCEEMQYLIEHKGLEINPENREKYYNAVLWGSKLSAAEDAKVVFYNIDRDESGKIQDADYNFVEINEFERTYEILC